MGSHTGIVRTPQEYLDEMKPKPLTAAEIKRGKNSLCISGTDTLMPWEEIYTRVSAGMDMGHIAHIYGHGRKIALWAVHDKITTNDTMSKLLDDEITQRRKVDALTDVSPTAANTLMEMANEYAPDVSKKAVLLSQDVLKRASAIVNELNPKKAATSLDLVNIMKAQQMVTDSLGLTDRHASSVSHTQNNIMVSGFEFVLDAPPAQPQAQPIEAEVING